MNHVFRLFLLISVFFGLFSCAKELPLPDGPIDDPGANSYPAQLTFSVQEVIQGAFFEYDAWLNLPAGFELGVDQVDLVHLVNGNTNIVDGLYDNGDLDLHHDEIKGDGVYTGRGSLTLETLGEHIFRVIATPVGAMEPVIVAEARIFVFTDVPGSALVSIEQVHNQSVDILEQHLISNPGDLDGGRTAMINWLANQKDVISADGYQGNAIELFHKSGLHSILVLSQVDAFGKAITKGGVSGDPGRPEVVRVPVEKQTRGLTLPIDRMGLRDESDKDRIGNRKVLIYAPFDAAFGSEERLSTKQYFSDATCGGFTVDEYINQAATVDVVSTFHQYGTIHLTTHGTGGHSFLTGEVVDSNSTNYKEKYKALLKSGKLWVASNVVVQVNNQVEIKRSVYAITADYISGLPGKFPNTLLYNSSCESTKSDALEKAFLNRGVATYFGFSENVTVSYCEDIAHRIFKTIIDEGKSTGEVIVNTLDPYTGTPKIPATFQLRGSDKLMYSNTFINGGFEDGFYGLNKEGDGRYIAKLGMLNPPEGLYMGVISTGLGFTTATGSVYQTVNIPDSISRLSLWYNYLSEEFLEYIGSQYQDEFKIVLRESNGISHVLYARTIDQVAAEFGASGGNPGGLIEVSPNIQFDQGGVYMTGFHKLEFDISAYKGQCVTIIFACTDVGDSIYDTAILLDAITLQ